MKMYSLNRSSCHRRRVKVNFTLIELLVVIAIIAILAAILLPALNSARERGRSASCISNIKQSSAAMALYGDDHEEVYFFGGGRAALDAKDSNDSSRPYYQLAWASKLMVYGYLPYDQWDGVRCPSMKHDDSVFSTLGAVVKNELNLKDRAQFLDKPFSNIVMIADVFSVEKQLGWFSLTKDWGSPEKKSWLGMVHNGRANVGFLDLSVRDVNQDNVKAQELYNVRPSANVRVVKFVVINGATVQMFD